MSRAQAPSRPAARSEGVQPAGRREDPAPTESAASAVRAAGHRALPGQRGGGAHRRVPRGGSQLRGGPLARRAAGPGPTGRGRRRGGFGAGSGAGSAAGSGGAARTQHSARAGGPDVAAGPGAGGLWFSAALLCAGRRAPPPPGHLPEPLSAV